MAADTGLRWVAVTDHDTVAGHCEAEEEARKLGVGFVPGVELSVTHRGRDFHVLAYWIDPSDLHLRRLLQEIGHARVARVRAILDRLHSLGIPLTWERVALVAGTAGAVGRPHVARALRRIAGSGASRRPLPAICGSMGPPMCRRGGWIPRGRSGFFGAQGG
jgi:predicted metal-dependent phosphoesterase TrpH